MQTHKLHVSGARKYVDDIRSELFAFPEVLEVFVTGRPDVLLVVYAGRPRPGEWLRALRARPIYQGEGGVRGAPGSDRAWRRSGAGGGAGAPRDARGQAGGGRKPDDDAQHCPQQQGPVNGRGGQRP